MDSAKENPQVPEGWSCSVCGQPITAVEDGWVEWLATEDELGNSRLENLRLVHSAASERESGCRYDPHREFARNRSLVEGLPLERFLGADGLMLFLSFIEAGEFPVHEVVELLKRVQIPGYEQANAVLQHAVAEGLFRPALGAGYYLQSEIRGWLRWMESISS